MIIFLFNTLFSYLSIFVISLIIAFLGVVNFFGADANELITAFLYSLPFLIPIILVNYFVYKASKKNIERPLKYLIKRFLYVFLYIIVPIIGLAIIEGTMCDSDMCGMLTLVAFSIGIVVLAFSIIMFILLAISRTLRGYKKILPSVLFFIVVLIVFLVIFFFSPGHCPFGDEDCIANKAVEKNNPQLCEESKSPPFCYRLIAWKTGEVKYCDMIKTSNFDEAVKAFHFKSCHELLKRRAK